jgi:hypothetical protein
MFLCYLFLLQVFLKLKFLEGEIIVFNNHVINQMYPESWPIPKYSKRDAPNWSPGKGHSFIDFSGLKLKSYCSSNSFFSIVSSDFQLCSNTSLDILLFEEPTEFNWKDLWSLSGFCCTDQLVESGACSEAGTLIVPSKLVNAVHESKFVSSSSVTTSFVPQVGNVFLSFTLSLLLLSSSSHHHLGHYLSSRY